MNEFTNASQQQTQANAKAIANMERQIAQLAEYQRRRDNGNLPSNTEVNPNHTQRAAKGTRECRGRLCTRKGMKEGRTEGQSIVATLKKKKKTPRSKKKQGTPSNPSINQLLWEELKDAPEATRILKEMCTLPKREKDPDSPYIIVTVGDMVIRNTLLDLGASVNILPGYLYDKYKNEELELTKTILQLAYQSMKVSRGKLNNVIVKVGDFFYLVDFLVMEYESLEDEPALILGRPFLATTGAIMDCKTGDLDITFGSRKRRLNMFGRPMTLPPGYDSQYVNSRPLMIPKMDGRRKKNENRDNESVDEEILWKAKGDPLASVDKLQLLEMIEMTEKKHQTYAKDARNRESKVFQILDAQQQWINQFPAALEETRRYQARLQGINTRVVQPAVYFDRAILTASGLWDQLLPFLHHTWTHLEVAFQFTCQGWDRLMVREDDIACKELMLEFFSTCIYEPASEEPKAHLIRFRLGG
ncbi:hypothetical protein L2E82_23242 [Cichorium intybus]|uniref:Uncharacterized protein n=1 Tax=Cichorium intybus TaxID=13427 RepID=A0ACB9E084_CICIN|nr:hypothetical protein L2E82_23242 [Cichorium intybus]